jgi:hypothetical protein
MNGQNLFVLVCVKEDVLLGQWSFRASDELAVARHLLQNAWDYQKVFWALRISVQEVDDMRPEELLQAISDSYYNQRLRGVLYLLRVAPPADCDGAGSLNGGPVVANADQASGRI